MYVSKAGRWSLAALVVVVALIVAIWPRGGGDGNAGRVAPSTSADGSTPPHERRAADTVEALVSLREQAALRPCPTPVAAPTPGAVLSGISLECVGDGSRVDLAAALAGKPALLNLWAYWCGPCADELPHVQQFADRAAGAVTVVTVHTDPNESNALTRLIDYGIRLPGVQDGAARVQAAVGSPAVLPVSVLIRPDGSVAKVLAQPFRSVDEIAAAVEQNLGVAA